jgi:hypothetical protein
VEGSVRVQELGIVIPLDRINGRFGQLAKA